MLRRMIIILGFVSMTLWFSLALFSSATASTLQQAQSTAPITQEQVDRETVHKIVGAVQLHVDGLKDKVIFFTEGYLITAYEQQQMDWSMKNALRQLRRHDVVGDLYIQTSCGVGK